jgi:imidazole glycerol-phosphate synthase subunit HisH
MIAIVDYHMGNVKSIANMLRKAGTTTVISSDEKVLINADKLILPGVGAFDAGMKNISELGLLPILNDLVLKKSIPVLGICLGMQLLTNGSEEGILKGLGWIDAETIRFRFNNSESGIKVPHMGWNSVVPHKTNSLFNDFDMQSRFYFIHSYYVKCKNADDILATTCYSHDFTSAVQKGNIFGTQFHPEKSHSFGMRLLKNFANWSGNV